jgi:hypothetical protein
LLHRQRSSEMTSSAKVISRFGSELFLIIFKLPKGRSRRRLDPRLLSEHFKRDVGWVDGRGSRLGP